jgi:hypothetical protein
MRTLSKILAASAGALALAAASAGHAATVTIWTDDDGAGPNPLTFQGSAVDHFDFHGAIGAFTVNNISGDFGVSPISGTQAFDSTSSAAGDLRIFVSITDITAPLGNINWMSTFTTQPLSDGWTLTERTWLSPTNQPISGMDLGTHSFTANPLPVTAVNFAQVDTGAGAYAINTEYVLHASGAGTANSTVNVYNLGVPEPATWGMMVLGFGGAGAMVRSRRRQAALTA